ncbi:peptidylprolyl isomerase [Phaeovulum vinaykumarii]|uniref:Parvulin-like PPIase n=1 Tax=Phaeovulum vinaykumarii TaxID=407234 RepID=A0A1N7KR83_9RHOB|nr:peptidylprolyl isomerase [Phaeovulum vinaykumarii]SIS63940.1 peptidyl-prolyl cis-trans isomerase C [Phaeovulum vinaykumarii]SOC01727.1 peptidyl-prolyl cis-trans isomerase C [Phaeovulum vinaykumarii]
MPKTAILASALAAMTALGAPAMAETAHANAETVLATVNGQKITLGHLAALRLSLPAEYRSLPDDVLFNGMLEQLIQQTALAQLAEKNVSVRDQAMLEVDRRAYLAGRILDRTAERAVTDEDLRAEYEARYSSAEPEREYNASHILVETREQAEKIKSDLDGGADFADLARRLSIGPSGPNGGDLGWFSLGVMVKPFGDAIAAMKPDQVSDPVKTEYGWHVIKLNDTRLTSAPAIEDVREDIENDLRARAVETRVEEVLNESDIQRMADGIDPAVVRDESIFKE